MLVRASESECPNDVSRSEPTSVAKSEEVRMISTGEGALDDCSREPIHIPGAIQPLGVLFALDDDLRITQCSENVAAALGREPQAVLGCSVEEWLGCHLRSLVHAEDFRSEQPLRLGIPGSVSTWDGFLHRHRGQLILELESVPVGADAGAEIARGAWLQTALTGMESSTSVPALCQRACEQIKQLTGLDGVMVYKFHADGHGEVIAESKDEEWPKYLGLHYPASDIPPQARQIFLDNWVRMIPDRDYVPA